VNVPAPARYDESMATDNQPGVAIVVAQHGDRDAKLVGSALKRFGYSVMSSEDGREAGKLLTSAEPHLELAVIDPAVPGLDFRGVLKNLADTHSEIHVLCLCDEGSEKALNVSEFEDRIGGHLKRPFRRSHLLASILDATERPLVRTA
jgi:DNA-binding response OmpR family regulator